MKEFLIVFFFSSVFIGGYGCNKARGLNDGLVKDIVLISDVDKIEKNEDVLFVNGDTLSAVDSLFWKKVSHREIRTISTSQYNKYPSVKSDIDDDCIVLECAGAGSYMEVLLEERKRERDDLSEKDFWKEIGHTGFILVVVAVWFLVLWCNPPPVKTEKEKVSDGENDGSEAV